MKYLEEQFGIDIPPKRLISAALVLVLIVCMVVVISNGQLKGSYVSQGLIPQTFTFSNDNQVIMPAVDIIDAHDTYPPQCDKFVFLL
ncbi:hypothetical protein D3Z36_08935 [Lachnospiraceae bacterium]|nr:hypothetical protein [Lachnospiraceae bacterium]